MLLLWTIRVLTLLLAVVSVLPMIPSGQWWVRLWEMPRLQLAWALVLPLVLLAVHMWRSRPRKEHAVWLMVILATGGWQLSHILPFTPLWPVEVPTAKAQPDEPRTTFKVMTSNVSYENDRYAELLATVRREDPDLLLLIEVDQAWADEVSPLDRHYPYRVGEVRGEGLGIVLWSRFPLLEPQIKYLVSERRPSIFTTLDVPGVGPVRYIGTHPVPPGLRDRISHNDETEERRDSRVRDAELMLVARYVKAHAQARWIVTGDFNDVAWSDTTRLFADMSGLKDPRRGRGLFNTFDAKLPLLRYPIDHMFVSDGLHLANLDRVRVPGSDHFAITATLSAAEKDHTKPEVVEEEKEQARELIEEGDEDATEHDVISKREAQRESSREATP
ncbi:endonuclease/exonuclease/phosphatase family protein [Halomonas shantousis]